MLMFASASLFLTGCGKEIVNDSQSTYSQSTKTTYDVYVHDMTIPESLSAECAIIEYSDQNEPLETYFHSYTTGQIIRKSYTAKNNSKKVKVAFYIKSLNSSQSAVMWIKKVFYLNNGGNILVEVTGESPAGNTEP